MPDVVRIRPWPDPIIDTLGHDPRSRYVETFWLPTLGPTAVLALRRVADRLDVEPDGFEMPVADTSRRLGLGDRAGESSPLVRTLRRLEQFDLACIADDALRVRRHLPPVNQRHVRRLPPSLQLEHRRWIELDLQRPALDAARRRARRAAFTLFEQGADADVVERALGRIGFHPAVCGEATRWAHARHRRAADAAGTSDTTDSADATTTASPA